MPINPNNQQIKVYLGCADLGKGEWIRLWRTPKPTRSFQEIAESEPKTKFYGIDLTPMKVQANNWEPVQADFADGLKRLEDSTVTGIRSDLALGYYLSSHDKPTDFLAKFLPQVLGYQPVEIGSRFGDLASKIRSVGTKGETDYQKSVRYTREVLDLCHDKLCEGCDLIIRAETNGVKAIQQAVQGSKFNPMTDMQIKHISKPDEHTSSWEKTLRLPIVGSFNKFFDVTLTKQ